MSKIPQVRPRDLLRALQKAGFYIDRQTGSHVYLKHADGRLTSLSIHQRAIPKGTLGAILKQVKMKSDELKKLLR